MWWDGWTTGCTIVGVLGYVCYLLLSDEALTEVVREASL